MARPRPLSGFPEWLPAGRAVERHVLDTLARVFALHGFIEIETRAVEPLDQLLRKGETSKEVYVLRRLQDADRTGYDSRTLGLHFDLTVPLARYVLENSGRLEFPFMRYQCQKVWRGERPQEGRFREFLQADVDVIGQTELPPQYDREVPLMVLEALAALQVGEFRMLANNRKLMQGFGAGLGVGDMAVALRWLDKLDKIGSQAARAGLESDGLTADQAAAFLRLAAISTSDADRLASDVKALAAEVGSGGPLLDEGLAELGALLDLARLRRPGALVADLKIARGLDYYTGSVYETVWLGEADVGSVCSGGRYDSLASDSRATYPGVGLSVGVTRLVSRILAKDLLRPSRLSPAVVLVAVPSEANRAQSDQVAAALRGRGIAAEVAPAASKLAKQIRHAERRGIPYVWFPNAPDQPKAEPGDPAADRTESAKGADGIGHEMLGQIRDLRQSAQRPADARDWQPPAADRTISVGPPRVEAAGG
ncbi:MAG: histidine--tRNA ligase [Bifidobacteriaceae bacterium]|jgi:histidyl-tRNA synthetase|nr:histidine--tRNA ligase [Bifidobacteriaceae bacterium]